MRRMMIGADEQRDVFGGRALHEGGAHLRPDVGQARSRAREAGADLVLVRREMPEQDVAAVAASPTEEIAFLSRLAPQTTPQDAVFQTELARKRRENRGVAERIGRVQHVEASAEAFRIGGAKQEIADERLPRWDQLVGQHVPRTDLQATRLHERLEVVLALGTRAQVVLHKNGLAIEQERAEDGVGVQPVDQLVEHQDQARMKRGAGQEPLPIPMGVRNEMEDERRHGFSCDSSAVLERCTWATRRPRASRARMSPRAWA